MRYHRLALSSALCLNILLLAACGQSHTEGQTASAVSTPAAASPAASAATTANASHFANDAATLAVGETIYKQSCFACHDTGAAGAPKRGDKAAWAPRIVQGPAVLYNASLKGLNAMPPRGSSNASDEDIKAAVDYLVANSR
jgi:cytochrome c5